MNQPWDVIVVGAGAAGLYAAATAASRGRRTLLLEKNRKLGVKILMSGGTRCNITHNTTWRGIADAFGRQQGRFLKFALATLPPEVLIASFNKSGLATKVESTGKIFPASDRAIHVRDVLVDSARQAQVKIINPVTVESIQKHEGGFLVGVQTSEQSSGVPNSSFVARSVILTTGGQSYPRCGTTGDGYQWMKDFGHSVVVPRPALTPLRVTETWVRDLSGLTLPDVNIAARSENSSTGKKEERATSRGSFLFTHSGCSGPTVLNVSRRVTDPNDRSKKRLIVDFLPDLNREKLRSELTSDATRRSGKNIGNWLLHSELVDLPKRLINQICENAGLSYAQSLAEFSSRGVNRLLSQIKECELPVSGTLGFAKAEVTAGGVSLDEVDPQTMQSRLIKGLFLAGEILDVDGPIGGYNFQAAFSTGFVAGRNA